ncbi:glycosyltransferase [Spirosoma montaniterrae]|uniref:Glycosyl transferase family 1 n=1 Tax=Spirosoma montaniterrae TaxID=1178516 RepID=A0A1P9WWB6_9BACT|nr:glycosyltransferase [Spirosoma montaniterrae]AQG79669.1 glycosyl transferase family 1 [Spirosoma montaniterrae]
MRILIVHNILWAHYKSSVFQALQQRIDQQPKASLMVLQIARNERSRAGLETATDSSTPTYSYRYELLFDRFIEDVPLRERALALLGRVQAHRPTVILLTGYYDPAQLLLLLWAKAMGIRVIMQNESTAADQQRGGWKEQFKRWILQRCDGFFCFGNQSANYLLKLGVQADKILLRKNAVDNHALRRAYEKALVSRTEQQQLLGLRASNFVFVGRLIPVKNLPALVTAFADALQKTQHSANWGLVLLGDGPDADTLAKQISALGLANAVKLLPGRPWHQVPNILALSNVLVLPSLSEPWGLVVNEAMACGLPVVVSDRCGCVPDLVLPNQTGFVFDPAQPEQLTRHMLAFMNNEIDISRMSRAAQERIAPYAPEAVAQEMLAGFMKVSN